MFTFQIFPENNKAVNEHFDIKRLNSYIIFKTLTPTINFYKQLLDVNTDNLQPSVPIKAAQQKQKTMVP